MKIELTLIILALPIFALTQDDDFADNAPLYKNKYYTYHHFIDEDELKYIKSLRKLPEDTLKLLDEGLADRLVAAKTIKIGNEQLLIESDFYDESRIRILERYLVGTRTELDGLTAKIGHASPEENRYCNLYLDEKTYRDFADHVFADPLERAFAKDLDNYSLPHKLWGFVVLYVGGPKSQKHFDEHVRHDIPIAVNTLTEQFFENFVDARFLRIPIGLGFAISILKGFNWGDGTRVGLRWGDTGKPEKITLTTYPEWTDAIWRHYNDPKAATYGQEKYKLKYNVEGTHDGLEMIVTLKLWAFCDWMLLQKRAQLSAFLVDLHERAEKQKKENGDKAISTEQMKHMVTDALEKAFGKTLDAIEDDLKAYVKERYFTVAESKLLEKYCIFKEPKIAGK